MQLSELIKKDPVIERVAKAEEVIWFNPGLRCRDAAFEGISLTMADIDDAEARLRRFAPFIMLCFPETAGNGGIIESPLTEVEHMRQRLNGHGGGIGGRLLLKRDSDLAIAGSVKARGGIYEILKHTEEIALEKGLLSGYDDDYAKLAGDECRRVFSQYTVQVGSTGNLGLSIGIMSAALGFRVIVHMSADAKQWKKDLLRSKGVEVIEYADDYSRAVEEGRKRSEADPTSYFVDDEKSVTLFLGYAVAAKRLDAQLKEKGIAVDEAHPLIVYVPAGVGGAPGGVCYGLKRLYGDNVHCFFVEPTQCPSVLLGMATQKFEQANVRDYGLSGKTEADGLACASPSSFVTRIMTNLVSGECTVSDAKLYDFLRLLVETEGERIEPSSCAAFQGPVALCQAEGSVAYCQEQGLTPDRLNNATQIVWATGGRLVPEEIWDVYLNTHLDA